jgi:hypothetical protein
MMIAICEKCGHAPKREGENQLIGGCDYCDLMDENDRLHKKLYEAEGEIIIKQRREMERQRAAQKNIPIQLRIQRLFGKGFAAYINGSAKAGEAVILVDLHAILHCCAENPQVTWKEITSESIVHELLHMAAEILDKSIDCDEIEAAIADAQEAAKAAGVQEG